MSRDESFKKSRRSVAIPAIILSLLGADMALGQTKRIQPFEVSTVNGPLAVKDFTVSGGVVASSEIFYISYPPTGNTDTPGSIDYQILYFVPDKSFLVSLMKEPLGDVRRRATVDLVNRLGITKAQVCTLVAEVMALPNVNEYYQSISLGFPNCPGATKFQGD